MVEGRLRGPNEVGFSVSEAPACFMSAGSPASPWKGAPMAALVCLPRSGVATCFHTITRAGCVLSPGSASSHRTYPQRSHLVGYVGRAPHAVQPWTGMVPAVHTGLI